LGVATEKESDVTIDYRAAEELVGRDKFFRVVSWIVRCAEKPRQSTKSLESNTNKNT